MTLPKGFGSGGGGGAGSADVEKMIGRRLENMTGIITLSFIAAWLATFGGTAAGYIYYPWAYPTPSGHYAFIVLTIVEAIGYLFSVKVCEEGSSKNSNGLIAVTLAGVAIGTILISLYVDQPSFVLDVNCTVFCLVMLTIFFKILYFIAIRES